jgi:hypothetical protein
MHVIIMNYYYTNRTVFANDGTPPVPIAYNCHIPIGATAFVGGDLTTCLVSPPPNGTLDTLTSPTIYGISKAIVWRSTL